MDIGKKPLKKTWLNIQSIETSKWLRAVLSHLFSSLPIHNQFGFSTITEGCHVLFPHLTQYPQCFPLSCHSCILTWRNSKENSKAYLVKQNHTYFVWCFVILIDCLLLCSLELTWGWCARQLVSRKTHTGSIGALLSKYGVPYVAGFQSNYWNTRFFQK